MDLVDQTFRRSSAVDDDAAGVLAQARAFVRHQFAARIDHHRRERALRRGLREELEVRHVGQIGIEDQAIEGLGPQLSQTLGCGSRLHDVGVFGGQQRDDRGAGFGIVIDQQQAATPRCAAGADAFQGLQHRLAIDGLVQETDGAQFPSPSGIVAAGDDVHRHLRGMRIGLEAFEHVPAAHVRQADVEQHAEQPPLACEGQRVASRARRDDLQPAARRDIGQHLGEHRIVFDDQQRRRARRRRFRLDDQCRHRVAVGRTHAFRRFRRDYSARFRSAFRQQDAEGRSLALFAAHLHLPTEQRGHAADDRQAQSGAPVTAAGTAVGLFEGTEHAIELARGNPDAGVAHAQRHAGNGADHRLLRQQLDLALVRELECVGEQVRQDLRQARAVGPQLPRRVGLDAHRELQSLLAGQRAEAFQQGVQAGADVDGLQRDSHLAGLDLRQIENVVDQAQEAAAAVVHDPCGFDLLGIEIAFRVVGQHLRQDQHRVQRRAQLVRHVGEELALVAAGLLEVAGLSFQIDAGRFQLVLAHAQRAGLLLERRVGDPQLLGLGAQLFLRGAQPAPLVFQLLAARAQRFVRAA